MKLAGCVLGAAFADVKTDLLRFGGCGGWGEPRQETGVRRQETEVRRGGERRAESGETCGTPGYFWVLQKAGGVAQYG